MSELPTEALAPFVPRKGRRMARALMWLVLAVFAIVAFALPQLAGGAAWRVSDRVMLFLIGVAIAWLAHRYAAIRAVPSPEGIVVRNLLVTRRVGWNQVLGVQLGPGDPWVSLALSDPDTLAVMAIQGTDGEYAQREAERLAGLVSHFGDAAEPGPEHP